MKNTVELIGYYGDDRINANSAWTSTSRDMTPEKEARIPVLLEMLATNEHHTPFEKSSLHFLVNVDQATHIHLLKHRIGVSINGESARYKELKEDKFYLPEDFNVNINSFMDEWDSVEYPEGQTWLEVIEGFTKNANHLYHECLEQLTPILGRKRAKESARFFKTMNSQVTLDIMFNFRSFITFLNLRHSKDAQLEVRTLAKQMLNLVENIEGNPFKHTINAFRQCKMLGDLDE